MALPSPRDETSASLGKGWRQGSEPAPPAPRPPGPSWRDPSLSSRSQRRSASLSSQAPHAGRTACPCLSLPGVIPHSPAGALPCPNFPPRRAGSPPRFREADREKGAARHEAGPPGVGEKRSAPSEVRDRQGSFSPKRSAATLIAVKFAKSPLPPDRAFHSSTHRYLNRHASARAAARPCPAR